MGRLKKYTEEEKLEIKRSRSKKYYWDNKQDQDEKARELYRRRIQKDMP